MKPPPEIVPGLRPSVVVLLGLALAAGACRRPGPTAAAADGGAAILVPSQSWLDGALPPERDGEKPVPGGTLTIRVYSEPAGINRLLDKYQDGWTTRTTFGTIYETLLQLDRDTHPRYELKASLAERWEMSPDRLTNTLHLRRGVRFHNGEPFTSRDVKAVVDFVMDPAHATTTMRSFFSDLDSYSAPDEHTFVLRWKRPYYLGFRNFVTALPMMPASALTGDPEKLAITRTPVGTGPFRFESWETGRAITFVRNESYWGKKAYLARVVLRIVKDHTVATQMFERGDFDLMTLIQPTVWRSIETPSPANAWAVAGYNRILLWENNYSWLGWNAERPFFRDPKVRTALGMLMPYELVEKSIDLGLERPTTCPFYAESASCDPTVQRLPYDPKQARKLLAEAGWADSNGDGVLDKDEVPFKFTFLVTAHSVKLGKLAPLLQEEYRKAGLDMDIEKVEWAVFLERMLKHQFDVGSMLWSQLDVESDLYQIFHSSQVTGSNYVSYANPEVDALLLESRTEFDPEKRSEINRRIHRQLYQDQVYNFLTTRPALDAAKKHVRGLKPSLGWYDLSRVWIAPQKAPPTPAAAAE